jgi:AAA family ATP:ADP antiporter
VIKGGNVAEFEKFGKLRSHIWPIYRCETKRFLPASLMMFCVLFIYTLTRDLKDTMLVNAPGAEPACISSLKIYGVLPVAFLSVALFGKITNKFGDIKTFYITITSFLVFYVFFGFVLYPMSDKIHLGEAWVQNMQSCSPQVIHDIWPLLANWSFSLFYILTEIWSSLVLSFLFWQVANKVTKKTEAKRFYTLFACIGNLALILSGCFAKITIGFSDNVRVMMQMLGVLVVGLILMMLHYYIDKKVLSDSVFISKKRESKPTLNQSFKYILKSKYLFLIAVLVISYGIAINISEVTWKEQGKLLHGSEDKFNSMMADLSIITGFITIFITVICGNILRRCKWRTAALITPLSVLILGGMFFAMIFYENFVGVKARFFTFSILEIVVWIGLVQDATAKGIKYSLFDCTKQMAYRSLDKETRTHGQAAVEVVGGRVGKSLGSIIIIIIRTVCGGKVPLYSITGWLALILVLVIAVWFWSVINLSRDYEFWDTKKFEKETQKIVA